jgi:hypothetical protein
MLISHSRTSNYGYILDETVTYTLYPQQVYIPTGIKAYWANAVSGPVPVYQASLDPSLYSTGGTGVSYLINGTLFDMNLTLVGITDGSSNTMMFTEGYANCSSRAGTYNQTYPGFSETYSYTYSYTSGSKTQYGPYTYGYSSLPIIRQVAGKSFQDTPQTSSCDGTLAQSLSTGAVQVAMGDGSVRSITSGVTAASWTAAMTPTSNDTVGSDF